MDKILIMHWTDPRRYVIFEISKIDIHHHLSVAPASGKIGTNR
jgi:hypothetical protein